MRQIKITETVLRDGHQSLMATRLTTAEMLPIIKTMDSVGYHAIECWGGATFDAAIRFLNEDPWQRLKEIKKRAKNTKLQMLLRGQNLLGYRHYADDIVEKFIERSIHNGIDIVRVFDALNDIRNMETALSAVKKYQAHAQATLCYTISPVHNIDYFTRLAVDLENIGADSLCIKDMAGILTPQIAGELVSSLKRNVDLPIEVHTHATSGISQMTYLAAIKAGADMIDTAIAPFSEGVSQPATEAMVIVLDESEAFYTNLNMGCLEEVSDYFEKIKETYLENGMLDAKMLATTPKTLLYQVPGGMLSNLYAQLKDAGAEDKYQEVLEEVPRVRKELGLPPLVTPMSQMVGTQAVFNVITGERYKMVPNEIKEYVRGAYGKSTVPISDEIRKKIIGDKQVIHVRPADLIEPEFNNMKLELGQLAQSDEAVLTYAMFPKVGKAFLENKATANKIGSKNDEKNTTIKINAVWS
ncbi:oxaloacetate decarboxylase subunit alpha [Amphibacillus cookii]|uniref:oxaloacetate decarboxylase subunit alpha n=1 Tax=Amphibacillus cookii TaxID=767787 RepID=UPI001957AF1D|nr:oxaloacetate decarboxylase subunit alpha [Amphibacillus cookii]MBM7540205.1 oxaloacetate decarboxylase alpha subunit [Amphibacillus cookii]